MVVNQRQGESEQVLDPDALGAVVAGAKGVMTNRQNAALVGYDVPSYNPYAQPLPNPAQQPPAQAPQQLEEEGEWVASLGTEQEGGQQEFQSNRSH